MKKFFLTAFICLICISNVFSHSYERRIKVSPLIEGTIYIDKIILEDINGNTILHLTNGSVEYWGNKIIVFTPDKMNDSYFYTCVINRTYDKETSFVLKATDENGKIYKKNITVDKPGETEFYFSVTDLEKPDKITLHVTPKIDNKYYIKTCYLEDSKGKVIAVFASNSDLKDLICKVGTEFLNNSSLALRVTDEDDVTYKKKISISDSYEEYYEIVLDDYERNLLNKLNNLVRNILKR